MIQTKLFFVAAIGVIASCFSLYAIEEQKDLITSYDDEQMMSDDDCSTFTQDEQDFSAKLNDNNSMIFCSQMTAMQRQKAMQLSGGKGPSGSKMSPNEAVQQVMKNGKRSEKSGSCPVQ
jgi:hypothetical protein